MRLVSLEIIEARPDDYLRTSRHNILYISL